MELCTFILLKFFVAYFLSVRSFNVDGAIGTSTISLISLLSIFLLKPDLAVKLYSLSRGDLSMRFVGIVLQTAWKGFLV